MPTAHYIPLSALNENGCHTTHLNRTTALRLLDVEVPRSDPLASSDNNGGIPRTMDVTTNVSTPLTESLTNSDSTVNKGQKKKKNYINFNDRCEDLKVYKEKHGHLRVSKKDDKSLNSWCKNIRNARRNPENNIITLTADRIAALDAIGFDWRSETKTCSCQRQISFIDDVKNGHLTSQHFIQYQQKFECF
jgi:hypothetical protein